MCASCVLLSGWHQLHVTFFNRKCVSTMPLDSACKVVELLRSYVGEYVEGLDNESLNIRVYQGAHLATHLLTSYYLGDCPDRT